MALGMADLRFVVSLLLTHRKVGTLTGHPGHCKTTLFLGLCVRLALRLAYGPLTPQTECLLVYVVSAEDLQGTRNRILGEAARLGLDADDRKLLDERLRWV